MTRSSHWWQFRQRYKLPLNIFIKTITSLDIHLPHDKWARLTKTYDQLIGAELPWTYNFISHSIQFVNKMEFIGSKVEADFI